MELQIIFKAQAHPPKSEPIAYFFLTYQSLIQVDSHPSPDVSFVLPYHMNDNVKVKFH